ncbi:uncharacterized protein L969DRAFT_94496 [Mixia osmundae IAM 14324]|uniref:Zinc/iron permease n=1 Tax=Mixia osmundae (strain CBS 9802 / IAM 14324 / JCM 22182 / KY 12970) TaxID=764103 RepID=G7E3N9_MIXOS|nr:uncharacterized protein L969DRAFT_94496 [Mixia osmundae IAM 14324]KEI39432.1 hypothetical protein L969DRAFT_94496 [Mixia osmundae IAM 14324]GAA97449.1 hypothetical protein E5Q_04128 [Mixia osmundae IAM 14324]
MDHVQHFSSGVIIATAFIHLLAPAFEELSSPLLEGTFWAAYPFAALISMISMLGVFVTELSCLRLGNAILNRSQTTDKTSKPGDNDMEDDCEYGCGIAHNTHDLEPASETSSLLSTHSQKGDHMTAEEHNTNFANVVGAFILEAGVVLHSFFIGLTLAVTRDFWPLASVIIFHQTFEGLGLGTRLCSLRIKRRHKLLPYCAAVGYAATTPLGIAVGLLAASSYDPESKEASIVQGVLDSTSAGILLYSGVVNLLVHDFLLSDSMKEAPASKIARALATVGLGVAAMSLLGIWA